MANLYVVIKKNPYDHRVSAELTTLRRSNWLRLQKAVAAGESKVPEILMHEPLGLDRIAIAWTMETYRRAKRETNTSLGLDALVTTLLKAVATGKLDIKHLCEPPESG